MTLGGNDFTVGYEPAESTTGMFGGNSNWRGPVWFPVNHLIIEGLRRFGEFFGDDLLVEYPTGSGEKQTFGEIADDLARRLVNLFLLDGDGRRPVHGDVELFQRDERWRDLIPFYEYFHGDTGAGLGASHQTGWTALVVDLIITLHAKPAVSAEEQEPDAGPSGEGQAQESRHLPPPDLIRVTTRAQARGSSTVDPAAWAWASVDDARSSSRCWTSSMSFGEVREASQYMMPVGMKKTWNAASPTAKFSGGGSGRPSALEVAPDQELPAARPMPLTRLPRLKTVPRCSGGFTSVMRANQFGEFAEVRASATSAARKLAAITGSVTTLRQHAADDAAGAGAVGQRPAGAARRTAPRRTGSPARMPIDATRARPRGVRRCIRSPIEPADDRQHPAEREQGGVDAADLDRRRPPSSRGPPPWPGTAAGRKTSEPKTSCAVKPCSTSHTLVRRRSDHAAGRRG